MGLLSEFFVATPDLALKFARHHYEDSDEDDELTELLKPLRYKGFTGLEIGTLWAILEGAPWDVKRHMPENTWFGDETWLNRFPDSLTQLLASSTTEAMATAAVAWSKTEELRRSNPSDLEQVLGGLNILALHAINQQQSVYLWGSL